MLQQNKKKTFERFRVWSCDEHKPQCALLEFHEMVQHKVVQGYKSGKKMSLKFQDKKIK